MLELTRHKRQPSCFTEAYLMYYSLTVAEGKTFVLVFRSLKIDSSHSIHKTQKTRRIILPSTSVVNSTLNKNYGDICLLQREGISKRETSQGGVKNPDKNGGVIYGRSKAGWCVRAKYK